MGLAKPSRPLRIAANLLVRERMKISVTAALILSKEHPWDRTIRSLVEKAPRSCECQSANTQFRTQTDATWNIEI
jgi:hypothetical protein